MNDLYMEAQAECSNCGRSFPVSDLVQLLEKYSCAACKPILAQQITEGILDLPAKGPVKMYTPKQIAVATFLGAPIAGCWLLSYNYRQFSEVHKSVVALLTGVLATVLMMVVSEYLPDGNFTRIAPMAFAFSMYYAAKFLQGPKIREHSLKGVKTGSWWMVVGVSVLVSMILLAIAAVSMLLLPEEFFPVE